MEETRGEEERGQKWKTHLEIHFLLEDFPNLATYLYSLFCSARRDSIFFRACALRSFQLQFLAHSCRTNISLYD